MAYHCSQTEIPRLIHAQLRPDLQPYSVCCSLPTHPSIQQWEPHMFLQKLASIHLLFPLHSVFFSSPYYNHLVHSVHLKNAQHESCESSFIWSKLKTIAWETAFQIALRQCVREVQRRSVFMWFWKKGNTCTKHIFFLQKVSAGPEEQTSPWRTFVFFWLWGDTRIGLTQLVPENI